MPNDTRSFRTEPAAVLLSWGGPQAEAGDSLADAAAAWLGGGAVLGLWTAVALLLTSA
jgi:hypothetical protein